MKLTKEQLAKIDYILEKLGLDFLDYKLEVKDHIATQTEDLCEKLNISFEEALPKVLKEWEPSLTLKNSIWISNKRCFSKIIVDGITERYLIYNSIGIFLIILFFVLQYKFSEDFKSESLNKLMFFISSILVMILSFCRYLISIKNHLTSYSYEFNRMFKLLLILLCFDIMFGFFMTSIPFIFIKVMICIYFPFVFYFFIKHYKFQNKMLSLK